METENLTANMTARNTRLIQAVDGNYEAGNAEAIALAAEGAKWSVYQHALTSGDITVDKLLDFTADFYQDESWSSQLAGALDNEVDYVNLIDQVDRWESRNTAEYKLYIALKAKYEAAELPDMDGDVVRGLLAGYDAETIAIWIRQYVSFDQYGRTRMEETMRRVAARG